jgi:hypothetical protein
MAHDSGTQDSGLWLWPVDPAATNSGVSRLVAASLVLYALGTVLMLAVPAAAHVGAVLLLLGVAGSVMVLGKVIMVRSRRQAF